jgi:hypothetical protein
MGAPHGGYGHISPWSSVASRSDPQETASILQFDDPVLLPPDDQGRDLKLPVSLADTRISVGIDILDGPLGIRNS